MRPAIILIVTTHTRPSCPGCSSSTTAILVVLWWLIAVLGQDNLTWMKIRLSGGPFASVLHTLKIVHRHPLPKMLLDLLQVLPPRQLTEQSRQVRLRKTHKRCTYQEMPWTKTGEVILIIGQSC